MDDADGVLSADEILEVTLNIVNEGTADIIDTGRIELVIPENYADLYQLPEGVLNKIRSIISNKNKIYLEGPSNLSLFLYDNNTLIVESFNDETVEAAIAADTAFKSLKDLNNQEEIDGELRNASGGWSAPQLVERNVFKFDIKPHSYRVFRLE